MASDSDNECQRAYDQWWSDFQQLQSSRARRRRPQRYIEKGREDRTSREAESRATLEQMGAIRIRELELQLAMMEVLIALLAKETRTPTEKATKEALLEALLELLQ